LSRLVSLSRTVSALLAAFAGAALLGSCGGGRPAGLVLVTVDTLRADRVGAWGRPNGTTPALDAFAARSTVFPETIAPRSQTWPTLASILTSRYPVTHGVRKNGQALNEGIDTVAEVLAAKRYECAAFLSNSGQAGWPGFDPIRDERDRDRHLLSEAKGWLRANADRRFFLWIHFFAPHRPFQPPAPYVDLYDPDYDGWVDGSIEQMRDITSGRREATAADVHAMLARHDGEVRWFDRLFGELLGALDEMELTGSTVVALTADHGEELHARHRYFSHSASIHDTVLHVPLCIRLPGGEARGRVVPGITESIDVAPTLLALLGVDVPESWEGRRLDAAVRGEAALPADHAAFSELEDRIVSVRTHEFRYIHNPDDFDFPMEGGEMGLAFPYAKEELYRHADDPGERLDRAAGLPAESAALRERIEEWMDAHEWEEASRRHAGSVIPEEVLRSLEALGYAN
jgi:arylsulfatase A-like enzyme